MPIDVPTQVIEIRPTTPVEKLASSWEQNSPYGQLIVKLMHAMASDESPDGYAVTSGGLFKHVTAYGNRVSVKLKKTYSGVKVRGEVLTIKNTSSADITLEEKAFYQDGTRAIAIESMQLAPNDATVMYRVMSNDKA